MQVEKEVNPRFEPFIFDWSYKQYLLFGGYGSSKSYHIALKIVLKLLQEKRKCLVVREVYETIRDSCYALIEEILEDLNLLSDRKRKGKVVGRVSPLSFEFPNGSQIIFRGMDRPVKLKSIHNISIVWIEEASEVKYDGYKELLGRLRHPSLSLHMLLSWNPVDDQNWTYKHFFIDTDSGEDGEVKVIMDPERVYKKKTVVRNNIYYHHSLPTDNLFLPASYVQQLDELKEYDPDLWRVARLGQYGPSGVRVLPQYEDMDAAEVRKAIASIPYQYHFHGLDFGFEESYNALVYCAVDDDKKILYVYHEEYANHLTDPEFAERISYAKDVPIVADSAEPKAIKYYQMSGFHMRGAIKGAGSRLANTRKIKRFKRIVVSSDCPNCRRELKNLTYKKDARGNLIYDQFNIDPHTFNYYTGRV